MIQLGKIAPDFNNVVAYQNGDFKKISLSDYKGKWLVFFMYPRDFTFVCPTEIRAFAKHEKEFNDLGAEVLGCSTDSEWSHKAWFEKDLSEVKYPILADTRHEVARDYQVLNDEDHSAERGLFIIDPDGAIKYILVSAGNVGRSVTETLRVLKAVQSGDLCPVEWEPGQETLGKA
ncbi:thioredoxin peroxidase [Candidatus Uhrbacteria bacterium CG_4_9_14_0_2_um_filter_41_50]|uniref:Thioredoxin peroxidase n=1 Tax=Candidatus Uhrbacteria bacterium CG_4_9_14_0_2_um_filter_41_50 TaxID=1975031 RepID=A0A2M8EP55_9BACT|nr:MAG: thioredoxin peroxidase [Candidatus Uhrbacteria bacterium CG_4_10_14_3_um_filter_41_21]PIZ55070.1 MAG: thioredoxin peroxidase [Candidatus Uhrbacteria bacterium CG_4_10_14_0_2_um_filter_41_21]PJB85012.1 MAG: thioredoxin peroxidase [Candidatus Uhrbacteria bacterium CG_4_9_14_0_8_um_filter_41_16]PJC24519.1 MAG: thioredoxin peroxidase [Candidatus Uhrbacteria bacterium CG_4_9_14_0_2_um_filter_41_50]PJE74745.1 MAG: thioredoxin peroxidase [Candidatus Uhrbacteria bacterium CG10_big_fil_rev_8_21_